MEDFNIIFPVQLDEEGEFPEFDIILNQNEKISLERYAYAFHVAKFDEELSEKDNLSLQVSGLKILVLLNKASGLNSSALKYAAGLLIAIYRYGFTQDQQTMFIIDNHFKHHNQIPRYDINTFKGKLQQSVILIKYAEFMKYEIGENKLFDNALKINECALDFICALFGYFSYLPSVYDEIISGDYELYNLIEPLDL